MFSESEVEVYRNFDDTKGQVFLMMGTTVGFFIFFVMMVFGIVLESYYLIPLGIIIAVCIPASAIVYRRMNKPNIPAPVFDCDEASIRKALDLEYRHLRL